MFFAGCGDNANDRPNGGDPDGGITTENCSTPGDEDGNGLADCLDPACVNEPKCAMSNMDLCGNHQMDVGEECDDGNKIDGDGCDSNCLKTGCGNGIMTAGEQCDDGNKTDGDGCDSNCTPTGCGNGITTGAESCDDGNQVNGDGCDNNCKPSGCGNGSVGGTEECDDGNLVNGDGCDNNCKTTRCGNGIMTNGEQCDDGNTANWDGCSTTCTASVNTYVKASNTDKSDNAGELIALSADGMTLAVGAEYESSAATGVDGNQADNSKKASGAVYVYARSGNTWVQQAYIKASNTGADDRFGLALSLSADGSTLAVGAFEEDSGSATDQTDNSKVDSGAAYVFTRTGTTWSQRAYLKASTITAGDNFGKSVALSRDGKSLAVGAVGGAGTVYVFARTGDAWAERDSVTASNAEADDAFGNSVALSNDGSTLVVGAYHEDSAGAEADNSADNAGAAYVFTRTGNAWMQQAYLKASDTKLGANFGVSVSVSSDGATVAVGADRASTGTLAVDVAQGAAYLFARTGTAWAQSAVVRSVNARGNAFFGHSVALSDDGTRVAVGAYGESSDATGVGGDETRTSKPFSGAAYLFVRAGATWTQQSYVKAMNTDAVDFFGNSVALSSNGATLAVGAPYESSSATGINGDQSNTDAGSSSGAVYVYQ